MRLDEGQVIAFAGRKLVREGGRLVSVDAKGGKRPLPIGALLLKTNDGRPFATVTLYPTWSRKPRHRIATR